MRRRLFLAGVSLASMTFAATAEAQSSTETYTYDALGRLVKVQTSGGQNDGETRDIAYDHAGNRTSYAACTAGLCSPTPSPTPTPTPTPSASFSISDAQGTEGTNLVFAVTRAGGSGATHSVAYATATGTAASNDFSARSGTLTFGASQSTATITVPANADFRVEGNEIFYVNLSNPSAGAVIADGQGMGTIFNDDSNCTTC